LLLRKSASIILLLVLLFNMIGYRAWFYYAEKKADASMEARLDKDQYDENELVSISIPLYNPYQLDQNSFERVNGEFNYQGNTFKLVKRRISDGNLVLLCIPDAHKTVLKKAKTEFGNLTNDLTGNGKNTSRSGLQKNFPGSDYTFHNCQFRIPVISISPLIPAGFNNAILPDAFIPSPGKPPQFRA
jgi:cbb3-type cytochrome oxidase subunit 3